MTLEAMWKRLAIYAQTTELHPPFWDSAPDASRGTATVIAFPGRSRDESARNDDTPRIAGSSLFATTGR
jgi:hypothetical protein